MKPSYRLWLASSSLSSPELEESGLDEVDLREIFNEGKKSFAIMRSQLEELEGPQAIAALSGQYDDWIATSVRSPDSESGPV